MSVRAMAWALRTTVGDSSAKMLLLVLANYADERGGSCFPSQKLLARQVECTERTVRTKLKVLEADGLICRSRWYSEAGRRMPDHYQLNLNQPEIRSGNADWATGTPQRPYRKTVSGTEEPSPTVRSTIPPEWRRGGRPAGGRPLHPDEGHTQAVIAERLDAFGVSGWDILFELPPSDVGHLCSRQRQGTLDDAELAWLAGRKDQ